MKVLNDGLTEDLVKARFPFAPVELLTPFEGYKYCNLVFDIENSEFAILLTTASFISAISKVRKRAVDFKTLDFLIFDQGGKPSFRIGFQHESNDQALKRCVELAKNLPGDILDTLEQQLIG